MHKQSLMYVSVAECGAPVLLCLFLHVLTFLGVSIYGSDPSDVPAHHQKRVNICHSGVDIKSKLHAFTLNIPNL